MNLNNPTRREVVKATAAALIVPSMARADQSNTLTATPAKAQLLPADYPPTDLWTFNGFSPGPEIRARRGERIQRTLGNNLDQPTTIHWHGIRIANEMDGVPDLTQRAVEPGGQFVYDFVAPDAGTYWYHSHASSAQQVAMGLYGSLIVEEPTPPDTDLDMTLVLDDWRVGEDGKLVQNFGAMHDNSHGGRIGNLTTTNGEFAHTRVVRQNERLRLRLINAANARIFELSLEGLTGWQVALDGMPLDTPEPIQDRLALAPAQRVDLIVDVTAEVGQEAFLVRIDRSGGFAQATFQVQGKGSFATRQVPAPLPPNIEASLEGFRSSPVIGLAMEGGAMGGAQGGLYQGSEYNFRQLVARGQLWTLGGVAGLPETPLVSADRGEIVRISIPNNTAFPHGMHLHGHHFRQHHGQGRFGPLRDTLLIPRGETAEIAFNANNPGNWLLHCHMLGHQATGMKTWIHVA